MEINLEQFVELYYEQKLPIAEVARIMEISKSTLYINVKRRGLNLRNFSEANFVAMEKGRWNYPNEPYDVDWEKFKELYYT